MDLSGKGICDDEIATIKTLQIREGQRGGRMASLGRNMNISETIYHIQKNSIGGILNLSNNYIYNNGATQILIAINKIDEITTIDLSSNRICATNISEFIPVLLETLKTKKVILLDNPIYDDIIGYRTKGMEEGFIII